LNKNRPYKAVVVGTSAGGLFALSSILEKLPKNYPLPIIVVQHRSKEPKDLLEEVLQNKCAIKIKQADEKEKIQSGIVYIAPSDYHLMVEDDFTFALTDDELVQFSRPSIDVLFQSAADAYKDTLIAIVLTGANSDGAVGITAVAANKGLTIVQNPEEAQFQVMPQASIRTKKVDHVFTLAEIQEFLLKLS